MPSENKLLDNLNTEQKKAVLDTEGPNLIVAGAGFWQNKSTYYKIGLHNKSKEGLAKSNFVCDVYK